MRKSSKIALALLDGMIFIVSDIVGMARSETICRNLNRLMKAGMIRRILKGNYNEGNNTKMAFKYRTNKEVTGLSPMPVFCDSSGRH